MSEMFISENDRRERVDATCERLMIADAEAIRDAPPATLYRWERAGKMSDWLRIGEAAALLGVCTATLRRWDRDGKLVSARTSGGERRYTVRDLVPFRKTASHLFDELLMAEDEVDEVYCYWQRGPRSDEESGGRPWREVEEARWRLWRLAVDRFNALRAKVKSDV